MIVASEIELRAGARLLLESASFQVSAGDRIGLVGRNGAGKTTLAKVLAGEAQPAAGSVRRSGAVGYLPQDLRTEPEAGCASPASTLASVVFPAPFRPTRPIRSPVDTWNDALSSSRRAPARSSMSLATIMI